MMFEGRGADADSATPAPTADTETELKFSVSPDALGAVRAPAWLRPLQQGRTVTRLLRATYFDTADRALWNAGFCLRVRREGGRFVQTVKSRGILAGDAFTRDEWQTPVPGGTPDTAALVAIGALLDRLPMLADAVLEPVFETDIRRTKRVLAADGSGLSWYRISLSSALNLRAQAGVR